MSSFFRPRLISFEGIDGSGKSTQAQRLGERLRAEGEDPLSVREPGGSALSERIREILLDGSSEIDPRAELLLFAAARAQLTQEVIRPAIEMGRTVICDRFFDSTTAYQGGGRELADRKWMSAFHRFTTGGVSPDRTYVIDVPIEVAEARRGALQDRMEAAGFEFFQRVRKAYREIAEAEPERVLLLDGTQEPKAIHDEIWADLMAMSRGTAPSSSG